MICHYITPDWKLRSLVLQTRTLSNPLESHIAVNVAGVLEAVVEDWGLLGKCQGITTDNGCNMVKAVEDHHLPWQHISRCAHTSQIAVKAGVMFAIYC